MTLVAGLRAAAYGVPFQPVGGVHGSDLAALNGWRRIQDPYGSGQEVYVIPAIRPDVAVIHANEVDEHGNALGGIRTPWVDSPIATLMGLQPTGSLLCIIFGTTTPFDEAKLAALYPTPKAFTKAHGKALKRAVKKGWILKPDAKLIKQWAAESGIGG